MISKIELHYSHDTSGKKTKNTIERGTIFVRPDPTIANMFTTAVNSDTKFVKVRQEACQGGQSSRCDFVAARSDER